MDTIYVDKHTVLEAHNSVLRIRHHSEHMQIQTTLERSDIQSIEELIPQKSTSSRTLEAVAIRTVDEQVVIIPVWSYDDARIIFKSLSKFWRD